MSEREAGTSWWAVAGSFVGIIVAAVIASFIQTALEHWVIDYFGTTMTLTLESIVVALAITFLLPFALAAAFGYFWCLSRQSLRRAERVSSLTYSSRLSCSE